MKRLLITILAAVASACFGAPPSPYAFTVNSQGGDVPALESYQALQRVFLVTFKSGTNAENLTSAKPFMFWAASDQSANFVTAQWAIVTATSGLAQFTFSASSMNSNGNFRYGVGVKDTQDVSFVVKHGRFRISPTPWATGVAAAVFSSNQNLAGWTFINDPWAESAGDLTQFTGLPTTSGKVFKTIGTGSGQWQDDLNSGSGGSSGNATSLQGMAISATVTGASASDVLIWDGANWLAASLVNYATVTNLRGLGLAFTNQVIADGAIHTNIQGQITSNLISQGATTTNVVGLGVSVTNLIGLVGSNYVEVAGDTMTGSLIVTNGDITIRDTNGTSQIAMGNGGSAKKQYIKVIATQTGGLGLNPHGYNGLHIENAHTNAIYSDLSLGTSVDPVGDPNMGLIGPTLTLSGITTSFIHYAASIRATTNGLLIMNIGDTNTHSGMIFTDISGQNLRLRINPDAVPPDPVFQVGTNSFLVDVAGNVTATSVWMRVANATSNDQPITLGQLISTTASNTTANGLLTTNLTTVGLVLTNLSGLVSTQFLAQGLQITNNLAAQGLIATNLTANGLQITNNLIAQGLINTQLIANGLADTNNQIAQGLIQTNLAGIGTYATNTQGQVTTNLVAQGLINTQLIANGLADTNLLLAFGLLNTNVAVFQVTVTNTFGEISTNDGYDITSTNPYTQRVLGDFEAGGVRASSRLYAASSALVGSELITNGTFAAGTNTSADYWTLSLGSEWNSGSGGRVLVSSGSTATLVPSNSVGFVPGAVLQVTYTNALSWTGSIKIAIGGATNISTATTGLVSVQIGTVNDSNLVITISSTNGQAGIDNVSVKATRAVHGGVAGNWSVGGDLAANAARVGSLATTGGLTAASFSGTFTGAVARIGDTMTAPLTNLAGFYGDGSNVTNVNAELLDGLTSTQFLVNAAGNTLAAMNAINLTNVFAATTGGVSAIILDGTNYTSGQTVSDTAEIDVFNPSNFQWQINAGSIASSKLASAVWTVINSKGTGSVGVVASFGVTNTAAGVPSGTWPNINIGTNDSQGSATGNLFRVESQSPNLIVTTNNGPTASFTLSGVALGSGSRTNLPTYLVANAGNTVTVNHADNLFSTTATTTPWTVTVDLSALGTGEVWTALLEINAGTNSVSMPTNTINNIGRASSTNLQISTTIRTEVLLQKPLGSPIVYPIQLTP